ncbi:hypothetical protein AArcSl_0823 [Halalkaliarchaeum desulfuricum]|uniref:Uncharacterized protein n=1 Tax=Halalkaliarchaeum desulfuricum TaxID=2055893 RepID=A0A343TH95_9EURY|nr:hypothetical protein AArcSl_0823 [Halalkaliarchaeum desulfuricum]
MSSFAHSGILSGLRPVFGRIDKLQQLSVTAAHLSFHDPVVGLLFALADRPELVSIMPCGSGTSLYSARPIVSSGTASTSPRCSWRSVEI